MSEIFQPIDHYTRLMTIHPELDPAVADRAATVAEMQQSEVFKHYSEFVRTVGRASVRSYLDETTNSKISLFDIVPNGDYDEDYARVYHLPMGNGIDPNQIYTAATIFAAEQNTRLIAVGNPGSIYALKSGYQGGKLGAESRKQVAAGDFGSTVTSLLAFLESEGINSTDHIGYSYGADKAVSASLLSANYDQEVETTVVIEPASVVKRSLGKLGLDFMKSNAAMAGYVEANADNHYDAARKRSPGALRYPTALVRGTNIAIAKGIAKGGFEQRANAALEANDELVMPIIWGSDSELAVDAVVTDIAQNLAEIHGANRVEAHRVVGGRHALANDLALQSALILNALGDRD